MAMATSLVAQLSDIQLERPDTGCLQRKKPGVIERGFERRAGGRFCQQAQLFGRRRERVPSSEQT
jgi:hypothetical protein